MSRSVMSWGRLASVTHRDIVDQDGASTALALPEEGSVLPQGLGRSYGDVGLNEGGTLLSTRRLKRVLHFNRQEGIVRVEAGISIEELLAEVMPAGWFIPVTPGTQFVTLGGAIANDVHGKNHHRDGTLGRFVRALELWRSDGSRTLCSPDRHPELFAATIGGLGLTGLIRWAEIQLIPIRSSSIIERTMRLANLGEFGEMNDEACQRSRFTVAWIDAMAPTRSLGRGLYMEGDFADNVDATLGSHGTRPRVGIPNGLPGLLINRASARAFNAVYARKQRGRTVTRTTGFVPFFYPLDAIDNWNRLYGRRGFFQHQSVIPPSDAMEVVRELLQRVAAHKATAPMTVLKTFGDRPSPGMLSFPMAGLTLAIDIANDGEPTNRLLDDLDAVVATAGGRLYPAKDARMKPDQFQKAYPRWEEFSQHVDPRFSSSFWRRVTG